MPLTFVGYNEHGQNLYLEHFSDEDLSTLLYSVADTLHDLPEVRAPAVEEGARRLVARAGQQHVEHEPPHKPPAASHCPTCHTPIRRS